MRLFLLIILPVFLVSAEERPSPLAFYLYPSLSIPAGESAALFSLGGSGDLSISFHFQSFSFLKAAGRLGYAYIPLAANQENHTQSLSVFSLAAGPLVEFSLVPAISVRGYLAAGYYHVGKAPRASGLPLNPELLMAEGTAITIDSIQLPPIFPVFYPQIVSIREKLETANNPEKWLNQLGVVYARYGLLPEAEETFLSLFEAQEYLPALVNVGNLYYLHEKPQGVLDLYRRVESISEDNLIVILGIACTSHKLKDYSTSEKMYLKLQSLDPELAERFAYLGMQGESETRAASVKLSEVLWQEE